MYLWALVSTSHGLAALFFGNANRLTRLIVNGEVDVYLLQPAPLLPDILGSRMVVSGLGDVLYGIILFAVTQSAGFSAWMIFAAFCLLGMLLNAALHVLFHSLTFFVGDADGIAFLASEAFISFSIYPGQVFSGPVRLLMHSFIPVAWAAWIPADLALSLIESPGGSGWLAENGWTLLLIIAADLLFLAFAVAMFYLGLRRYESGNRISARM